MKKTLTLILVLGLLLCTFSAHAESETYAGMPAQTASETYAGMPAQAASETYAETSAQAANETYAETSAPTLTVGQDGVVRDASGQIYGATKAHDAWIQQQHAQGLSTNAVAYRPLTVRNGAIYSDQTGEIIGYVSDFVGKLGDSSPSTSALFACAAALCALSVGCRKRRTAVR